MLDNLAANEVYKSFTQGDSKITDVLMGVSVKFEMGKTYAITGVSGAGKSTLLHVLGGLDKPSYGSVTFKGQDIYKLKAVAKNKFLNQDVGFVFQFHYLIKEFTALENIILVGLIKGESKPKCITRAKELLIEIGLQDKMNNYPSQLSGGQQQRIAIARAIFNKPAFILADEPTGNLDHENAMGIVDLMLMAQKEWGMGIIIGTHDPDVFNKMDHVYTLHNGTIVKKLGHNEFTVK